MPKTEKEEKSKVLDYESLFSEESIQKSVNAGEIFPKLKAELNKVYEITLKRLPVPIDTKLGKAFAINFEMNGMKMSMITPNSFLYSLTVERKRLNLTKAQLIGKKLFFLKAIGKSKNYGESEMYSVQIKD